MKCVCWGCFFLSLFFSGCETENISGGSSEHENVVQVKNIPVQVVDENGRFLKYVQLNFIEWSHWASFLEEGKSILIDTLAIADKRGRLSIESGFCSHAALDVKFGVLDKFWGNIPCSEAEPFVKLSVGNPEVQCGKTLPNLPVAVYGTDVISQSDGYGAWKLNIPPNLNRWDVVVKYEGFWRPLGKDLHRLLVENFEENSPFTLLHRFNAGSRWWAAFDADSVIREFSDLSRKRVFSDSSHGRSLHVLLIPQDSLENSKAMVGFDWGHPIGYPDVNFIFKDLSYADSLYFSAKGSGTLGVQMICRSEDLLQNAVFEKNIHLDSLWQEFAIGMEEFRVVAGDSLDVSHSWDDVKTHCKATAFYAKGPVDLWLDDIAIGGVRLRDIE